MSQPQLDVLRRRLQQLLAIPDRQRTDAEWDELNELEIMFAEKRVTHPHHALAPSAVSPRTVAQPIPSATHNKRPAKKPHNRPTKGRGR